MVISAGDLESHPLTQLRHRHGGVRLARVFATLHRIGHRCAWQAVYPPHQSAQIALNMTAILRSAGRPIFQPDSVALATTLEGYAVKLGSIVQV
jgi:hypothetical protein